MASGDRGGKGGPAPIDGEGFLGRWSRRKAEARLPAASDLPAADAEGRKAGRAIEPDEQRPSAGADTEPPTPPPAAEIELPDIDQMGPGSDFRVFMQAGVPSALKIRALRKLWRVKPELANLDGLLDYGEDLTGSFKVMDHLKTAYQVGRGFIRDDQDPRPEEKKEEKKEEAKEVAALEDDDRDPRALAKDAAEPAEPAGIEGRADGGEPEPDAIGERPGREKPSEG
jgi:hypothetical protein